MSKLTLEKVEIKLNASTYVAQCRNEIDWLIQEVNVLNGEILGRKIVEGILKEKVKSLEAGKTRLVHLHKVIMEREDKDRIRVKELEEGIRKFDDEVYDEHSISISISHSLTKLLKLIKKEGK